MRRAVLACLALAAVAVASGCASEPAQLPVAAAAPPQSADVDWVEPTQPRGQRLVFEVETITVTADGWRAQVGIRNETQVAWIMADARLGGASPFGLMLFATGDMAELDRRNRDGDLPVARPAQTVTPAPPTTLGPGERWEGTIEAPGALAAGRWARVTFGPLVADGDAPKGLPSPLLWITDNAHLLTG